MHSAADYAWLIPVLPLIGALITGMGLISFNRTINRLRKPVAVLLLSCVGAAAVISYAVLFEQFNGAPPVEHLFVWASAGSFSLPMGYVVDPLGSVMLALVTTIALLVLIYSHGYMAHDKSYVRFFTIWRCSAADAETVISPNLLEIYVFWELVGMCSYLLVGFWYDRDGAARGPKAFIVNRVTSAPARHPRPVLGHRQLRLPGHCRWLGVCHQQWLRARVGRRRSPVRVYGADGQVGPVPLHVWLDAMEGPTPISA